MNYSIAVGLQVEAEAAFAQAVGQGMDNPFLRLARYDLAFLQEDHAEMQEQQTWAVGKLDAEDMLLNAQADTEAFYGRMSNSRDFSKRAIVSATRADAKEAAALWAAMEALREAENGNSVEAKRLSQLTLNGSTGRDVRVLTALVFARSGSKIQAQSLAEELDRDFPVDTMIQSYWLPTIRAVVRMHDGKHQQVIELLQSIPYALGQPFPFEYLGTMYPTYVLGEAYIGAGNGQAAAAEFQKILNERGIVLNYLLGSIAYLQLGRAYSISGDAMKAHKAYRDFLTIWKDADPDIPILKEARAEYAKLQ